jgi:hypothetical protein
MHSEVEAGRLGQNKRYGTDLTWAAVNESIIRPKPISLSKAELGEERVTTAEAEAVEVEAWVRFPEHPIKVQARAVAWTRRAVWVEFTMLSGATYRAWVWASAVERTGPPPSNTD